MPPPKAHQRQSNNSNLARCAKLAPVIKRSHSIFHRKNFAVATGVKKTSIRGKAMHPLHTTAMLAGLNDIEVESRWISTEHNATADLLFRDKFTENR